MPTQSRVAISFRQGQICSERNFMTTGKEVYSYQMLIAIKTRGNVYILDKKYSPSVTTSKHIGYLMGAFGTYCTVSPDELAHELARR